jgi:nitrogen fixation protein FixH
MLGRALRLLTILLLALASTAFGAKTEAAPSAAAATWHFADIELSNDSPALGDVEAVRFAVVSASGATVPGLQVEATLNRPRSGDTAGPMEPILSTIGHELTTAGHYEVSLALNQPGQWAIEITARDSSGSAQLTRVISVNAQPDGSAPAIDDPDFLPAEAWGTVYRLDPTTGSVASLNGGAVVHAGGRWWMTDTQLVPLITLDPLYGGRWQFTVSLSDGVTGQSVSPVDLGAIRASVFIGSTDQPAIATAVAMAPDGKTVYIYWARQLGQGWLAWVARADPLSGKLLQQRMLQGAIAADSTWAQLDVTPDGTQLIVSEQVVQSTTITGYRLTTLDAASLDTVEEFRRTNAPDDPLTQCLIPYRGETGPVLDNGALRYSLCSPTDNSQDVALVTWNPLSGSVSHLTDLSSLAGANPLYVDGVASPDGHSFYAVNTVAQQIAEVNLTNGAIVKQTAFSTVDQQNANPSPLDRLKHWLLGEIAPAARAGILIQPGVNIAPDGGSLYLVSPTSTSGHAAGDGIWVLDTTSLRVTSHILSGQTIAGMVVTPDGRLAVVHLGQDGKADEISIVKPDGRPVVSLALPDDVASASGSH